MKKVLLSLLLVPLAGMAETYYLTAGGRGVLADPSKWATAGGGTAAAFDNQSDYVIRNGLTANSQSAGVTTFSGGRLIIGEVGGTKGTFNQDSRGAVSFNNQGVVFAFGDYLYRGAAPSVMAVAGNMTVTAPASTPFHLHTSTFASQTMQFTGSLSGAAGTGLKIGGPSGATSNLVIKLDGDCSGFAGNLSVLGVTDATAYCPIVVEMNSPKATHFGTVTIGTNVTLTAGKAAVEVGADEFVLDGGARLVISATATKGVPRSNAGLRAYSSVTVNGKVTVAFDDTGVLDDGLTNRIVVLTFPLDCTVDETNFQVEYTGRYDDYVLAPTVEVDEVAGVKRLVTGVGAIVHLVAGDYQDKARSATRTSCFVTASSWSDGQLPHAGVHYLVENDATYVKSGRAAEWVTGKTMTYLRTPDEKMATREFPGESLTLGDGCRLITFCQVFCAPKLCLKGGSQLWVGDQQSTVFSNSCIVAEGGVVELGALNGGHLDFDATSTLAGDGVLTLGSVTMTSNPVGDYRFASDNSSFVGRIHATQVGTAPEWGKKIQILTVYAESELGGDLEDLDEKGLIVDLMSNVRFKESMTLRGESNRGIYIGDSAVFDIDTGKDVVVNRQLTMHGLLYKQGLGSLSLGGNVRFDSANGICDEPQANSNLLTVASGSVKVRSAGAIDGLNVSFGKNATLELVTDAENADLVKYGIRNVKTDAPFVLPDGKTTLPLTVDWTGAALSPDKEYTQGILTVANVPAVVSQVRAMLPKLAKPITGCRMMTLEIENDDGSLTFAVNFKKTGFAILIR